MSLIISEKTVEDVLSHLLNDGSIHSSELIETIKRDISQNKEEKTKKPKLWKRVTRSKEYLESLNFVDVTPRFVDRYEYAKVRCSVCGEEGKCIFSNLRTRGPWKCKKCVSDYLRSEEVYLKRKTTMKDRTGFEFALQSPVVQQKKAKTNRERFGCDHAAQNNEVMEKCAKNSNKTIIKRHWLTNKELKCTASYECAVVDWLNLHKKNYEWQPKPSFNLSTGRKYFIDLYLSDEDLWVEIKGVFRGESLEKWTEFHTFIHQNSELWDKEKLKELGIL